jgi:predicted permease
MLFSGTPYSGEIIIYAAVVISIFNILNWTVGVYMITKDKGNISLKKVLLNPTIIAVFIGALYFFIVKRPIVELASKGSVLENALTKIMGSLDQVGNMVTPLSMFVIGMRLANVKMKQLFLNKWAYVVCVMKLAVMSCVSVLLVVFLPVSVVVKYVIFFLFSMPSATSSALFAVKFGGDSDSASIFVLLTTILCILTIPLTYLVFGGVLGTIV